MSLERPVSHVLYDLDGVLLDTEPLYTRVTGEIVAVYGKTFDWSVKSNMIGLPSQASAEYLVAALKLPISAQEYLDQRRYRLEKLFLDAPAKSGAETFTRRLHARSVPQAVATSSERRLYELKICRHRQWFSLFETTVTGDDDRVKRGKPEPDIFRVAAEEMAADPASCLVLEDSPAGVAAAKAAGMQVVAMPDAALEPGRLKDADLIVAGFEELEAAVRFS